MNQNSERLGQPVNLGSGGNSSDPRDPLEEAGETLRLLASAPAPEGLEDRVHLRLRALRDAAPAKQSWFGWAPTMRVGFAMAVVVLAALAGEGWNLYRTHMGAGTGAAGQASNAPAISVVPVQAPTGGFSQAGTMRVPPTLTPLHVPPAPKKKTGAKATTRKPGPKVLAAGSTQQPNSAKR